MKNIFLIILSLSFIYAEINISGDARIRPRLDIIDIPSENKSNDIYYLYRARLNIKTNIGDGYFLNLKLGTNDLSSISKMANEDENFTDIPSSSSNLNAKRPKLHFLEIYYGYKKEQSGLWAGAFPIKHNPALDLHYYSDKLVDIPWALYNNASITGVAGFRQFNKYIINWLFSIDNDNLNYSEIYSPAPLANIKEESSDTYTFGLNSTFSIGPLNINPYLLYTFADESEDAPMTFGSKIKLKPIAGISSSASYYISSNSNTNKYVANHLRLQIATKLGKGKIDLFYDIASKTPEDTYQIDKTFIWLSYSYTIYKSNFGSLGIKPTIRIQNNSSSEPQDEYKRTKLELTTEFKFK